MATFTSFNLFIHFQVLPMSRHQPAMPSGCPIMFPMVITPGAALVRPLQPWAPPTRQLTGRPSGRRTMSPTRSPTTPKWRPRSDPPTLFYLCYLGSENNQTANCTELKKKCHDTQSRNLARIKNCQSYIKVIVLGVKTIRGDLFFHKLKMKLLKFDAIHGSSQL